MMSAALRPYVTAGVALIGAGIITVTPSVTPLRRVEVPDIQLTAGPTDIVIDILRHGQRMPPHNLEVNSSPDHPGTPLSPLGVQEAQAVGQKLFDELGGPHGVAGIFEGQATRDMETAAPFAAHEQMTPQVLPGLNELDPGILQHLPLESPGGKLAELIVLLGAMGYEFATVPGSSDTSGVDADEKFTGAVDAMYNAAMANPVVSDTGQITDVAFNNEADIALWVAVNAKNYELPLFVALAIEQIRHPADNPLLPNTGIVQIEGNPTDGWTLDSWNGIAIPDNPGLLSELWVDYRDLVIPPQIAVWNLFVAAFSGDPATIGGVLKTGSEQVGAAVAQFPGSVLHTIAYNIEHPGSAFDDIIGAIHYLATYTPGETAGEVGAAGAAGAAVGDSLSF